MSVTKSYTTICCPNCGAKAYKTCLESDSTHQIIQTSCPSCDYLMVSCALTGKVVEAYAPGLSITNS
jgi:hypothetical protein